MTWWGVGAQAVSMVGSAYQAKKDKKAQKKLDKQQAAMGSAMDLVPQQTEMDKANQLWAVGQNKENSLWANDFNQANLAKQLELNRPDWSKQGFGSGKWNAENNQYDLSLDPSQAANLGALRNKESNQIGAMKTGFDVNSDVMNAYRGLQNPMLQQSRDAENARLAAMGLSTGSGQAWMNSQQALNDAQTRADQNAILAGFQADQSLQQNNRANLGSLGTLENSMSTNMAPPTFGAAGTTSVGAPTVNAPNASLYTAWNADQNNAQGNYASTLEANKQYGQLGQAAGDLITGIGGAFKKPPPEQTPVPTPQPQP